MSPESEYEYEYAYEYECEDDCGSDASGNSKSTLESGTGTTKRRNGRALSSLTGRAGGLIQSQDWLRYFPFSIYHLVTFSVDS